MLMGQGAKVKILNPILYRYTQDICITELSDLTRNLMMHENMYWADRTSKL